MNKRYVIYGPPGTGKSTEIISRVKNYIQESQVSSDRIGLCAYTRAASKVLSDRCELTSRWIGTIHSLAFKLNGCIYEQTINYKKIKEFENLSGIRFTGGNPDEADRELSDGDYYLALLGLHKSLMNKDYLDTYDNSHRPGTRDEFKYFIDAYLLWKKQTGYIDFNDMLLMALEIENTLPVEILFIDEAQDLSPLQWKLINKWAETIPIIHIAGDDDQAIYEWAGADPKGMINFEIEHKAERTILSQSHRVPKAIHEKAHEIISNIEDRVTKEYKPRSNEGFIEYYSSFEMLHDIEHGEDILILYRNHSLRKDIEEYFISRGIPYLVDNGKPGLCDGWYWNLISLFYKVKRLGLDNYNLTAKDKKILKQGIHEEYVPLLETLKIEDIFKEDWENVLDIREDIISYYTQLQEIDTNFDIKPTIHLSTIHGSKGREAKRVILLNGMGIISAQNLEDGEISGEARVFYVAVTRAQERLDIIESDNSLNWL